MSKAWSDYKSLYNYAQEQQKKREEEAKINEELKEQLKNEGNQDNTQTQEPEVSDPEPSTPETNKNLYPSDLQLDFSTKDPFTEFEKIDNYYNNKKNQEEQNNLTLERLEMPTQTEEDITELVKAQLDSKYNTLKNSQTESYNTEREAKAQEKDTARQYANASRDEINAIYDSTVTSAENQALKRGLARSSIIINQLDGIEKSRASELSQVATELNEELSAIDRELLNLEARQENALNSLDLDYASELQTQIQSEMQKLEEKKQEVIEFNNEVERLEAQYRLERQDQEVGQQIDIAELEAKYGIQIGQQSDQRLTKLAYAFDYLNQLSKNEALKMLTSDNMFAYYLGDLWDLVYYQQQLRQN